MQSNMNRRTGAAAIPCATLPTLPALAVTEPDPIFKRIGRFKEGAAFYKRCIAEASRLESAIHDRATEIADREVPHESHLIRHRDAAEIRGVCRLDDDDPRFIRWLEADRVYSQSAHRAARGAALRIWRTIPIM